jgi:hypothetical protein
MDTVFKKGDRVYDAMLGWGEFVKVNASERSFEVLFDTGTSVYYDENGALYDYQKRNQFKPTLSFTEYTLEGFSQDRPEPAPKPGDIVWVRDTEYDSWMITYFRRFSTHAKLRYGTNAKNSDNSQYIYYYRFLTTKNPYANESSI